MTLVKAENIAALDVNGFSDPYCILALVPPTLQPSAVTRRCSLDSLIDLGCTSFRSMSALFRASRDAELARTNTEMEAQAFDDAVGTNAPSANADAAIAKAKAADRATKARGRNNILNTKGLNEEANRGKRAQVVGPIGPLFITICTDVVTDFTKEPETPATGSGVSKELRPPKTRSA